MTQMSHVYLVSECISEITSSSWNENLAIWGTCLTRGCSLAVADCSNDRILILGVHCQLIHYAMVIVVAIVVVVVVVGGGCGGGGGGGGDGRWWWYICWYICYCC